MKPAAKLEDLIAENRPRVTSLDNDYDGKSEAAGSKNDRFGVLSAKKAVTFVDEHIDVHEDEGWITIPCKELPDGWSEEPDALPFRSLDRPFVFPGEQVHVLACLSPYKQDIEIITCYGNVDQNVSDLMEGKINHENNIAGESVLRMEEYRRQTEELLQRFRNSHFFVRIAEADEALWSKRKTHETFREKATVGGEFIPVESGNDVNKKPVDKGSLDASTSGGVAKNDIKCSLLANGDIVVLLYVNIGVDLLTDPVLEILQFEKYHETALTSGCSKNPVNSKPDPYGDLLKWLLPIQNSMSPPRLLSPSSGSNARNSLTKPNLPISFGSQNFLLGQFRSHSMSSISSNSIPPSIISSSSSRPNFALEDWDQISSNKFGPSERLLSFRGVSLEPGRFSVRCGLEGIYVPGRRWRRKIEIIQPLEIRSFATICNAEDLICVQIKNVSPAHTPDIVIYLDSITIVFEEPSKNGHPLSLPIACIQAGNNHSLPNLALRKGEEQSFILKPATSTWSYNIQGVRNSQPFQLPAGSALSSVHGPFNLPAGSARSSVHGPFSLPAGSAHSSVYGPFNLDRGALPSNIYSILVSCRSNYTESRLFFKHPTSWQPHIPKDLLISVASQMSIQTLGPDDRAPRLPFQVLTLQASNLTNEDLTLTLHAPASLTSPSVLSLSCSPGSPMNPFDEYAGRPSVVALQRLRSASMELDQSCGDDRGCPLGSFNEQTISVSDALPRSDMGRTHLWLKSRVPLGCVPSQCTATVKLELLPLTDGIITLDSLQINVDKGPSYMPEHPLKITATSSISTRVI